MARVTGLGDASVTISAAALLFACFLRCSGGLALHWMAAVITCGLVTAVGKVVLYLHGVPIPPVWLMSPSGHVAASVLVYGVLPLLTAQPRRGWIALASFTVALIAVSRVYLQAHSGADVVAGAIIGGACLAWFVLGPTPLHAPFPAGRRGAHPLRTAAPLTVLACLLVASQGWRLNLDRLLHAIANLIAS